MSCSHRLRSLSVVLYTNWGFACSLLLIGLPFITCRSPEVCPIFLDTTAVPCDSHKEKGYAAFVCECTNFQTMPVFVSKSIIFINLSRNNISFIPENAFQNMTHLRVLQLNLNIITELKSGIFDESQRLFSINLRNNEITSVPEGCFVNLPELNEIDLRFNRITLIAPNALVDLPILKLLSFRSNMIESISRSMFNNVPNLGELRFDTNQITSIPETFFQAFPIATTVRFDENSLTAIPESFATQSPILRTLYLSYNHLTQVVESTFGSFTQLKKLMLSTNVITFIGERSFMGLKRLNTLYLDGNKFTSLLPGVFTSLTELEFLDLSNNQLSSFSPETFLGLGNLLWLNLNATDLGVIPQMVFSKLKHISTLYLHEVKFQCVTNKLRNVICVSCDEGVDQTSDVCVRNSDYIRCSLSCPPTSSPTHVPTSIPTVPSPTSFPISAPSQSSLAGTTDNSPVVIVAVCISVAVIALIAVAAVVIVIRTRSKNDLTRRRHMVETQLLEQAKETFYRCYGPAFLGEESGSTFEEKFAEKTITRLDAFTEIREIARGNGGIVHKAKYGRKLLQHPVDVAIKSCHVLDVAANHRLLVEARLLLLMKHSSIMELHAFHLFKSSRPWLVTTFMVNGDLKMYLRGLRQSQLLNTTISGRNDDGIISNGVGGETNNTTVAFTNRSAIDIVSKLAGALGYLHEIGVIHGDIAARNVLCGVPATNVRLADFGNAMPARLADKGNLGDRYSAVGVAMPFRWMAPEALFESQLSHATDMWSFGVLLWEIDTFGKTPFGVLSLDEVKKELLQGQRPPQPAARFQGLYEMAQRCWATSPAQRLTVHYLQQQVNELSASVNTSTLEGINTLTLQDVNTQTLVEEQTKTNVKQSMETVITNDAYLMVDVSSPHSNDRVLSTGC